MKQNDQDMELLHLLRCCGHFLHHRAGGGKVSQSRVLHELERHGEMTQRELQERMGIQQASLSELVKKLEERGLIQRERAESDHRQVLIRLSPLGVQHNQEMHETRMRQNQELVEVLDEDERRQLTALLQKLLNGWESQFGKEGKEGRYKREEQA
jgi:DNA-binding MarR family transcriptional regulator